MKKRLFNIIFMILIIGNLFFSIKYFSAKVDLTEAQALVSQSVVNVKILDFTSVFIKDVLRANEEVSFETRLKLENMVRSLGDKEILAQWSKFTESKTESSAQEEVKNLLEILVEKVKVQ